MNHCWVGGMPRVVSKIALIRCKYHALWVVMSIPQMPVSKEIMKYLQMFNFKFQKVTDEFSQSLRNGDVTSLHLHSTAKIESHVQGIPSDVTAEYLSHCYTEQVANHWSQKARSHRRRNATQRIAFSVNTQWDSIFSRNLEFVTSAVIRVPPKCLLTYLLSCYSMCSTTTSHGTAVIEHIEQTDSVHTYRTECGALRCVASPCSIRCERTLTRPNSNQTPPCTCFIHNWDNQYKHLNRNTTTIKWLNQASYT